MGACREFLDLSPLGSVFPFAHGLKPLVSALPCPAPMQDLEWWPVLAWTWVLHPGWAVMVWSQASPLACSEHPLSTWAGFSCQLWLPCPVLMKSHCRSEAWEIANHNFVYSSCGVCWVSGSICPQEPQSLGRGKEDQTGLVWSPDHRRQLGPPYVGHRAAQVFSCLFCQQSWLWAGPAGALLTVPVARCQVCSETQRPKDSVQSGVSADLSLWQQMIHWERNWG